MDALMDVQVVDLSAGTFSNHTSLFSQAGSLSLSPLKLYHIGLYVILGIHRWIIFHLMQRCSPSFTPVPCSGRISCPLGEDSNWAQGWQSTTSVKDMGRTVLLQVCLTDVLLLSLFKSSCYCCFGCMRYCFSFCFVFFFLLNDCF